MPSQGKSLARDKFFEAMDGPEHVLHYGGINGEASIPGMPGVVRSGDRQLETKRFGLNSEPVPVMLRDAVTIDTAVRLTGISRITLQQAAHEGRLPVLKLGPDNAPYLVRLRDVVVYLATMWTDRRTRKELTDENTYLGFPEWLVRHLSESWPDNRPFNPGKWEGGPVKINRGGRPPGYNPAMAGRPGFSKRGKRLGRPPAGGWPEAQKKEEPGVSPTPPLNPTAGDQPVTQSTPPADLTRPEKLPKWHPQWVRPGASGPQEIG